MSTCVELPAIPSERWWGDHLRETRWQLELYRLLITRSSPAGASRTATGGR